MRILKDLDAAIEGRDVLIVEDIVDSGLTLQYLLRNLGSRNPRTLEVCALLTKPERRKVDLPTRYVGFEIPDRFVVGYGLDYAERYRNLPFVAALERLKRAAAARRPFSARRRPETTGVLRGTLGDLWPRLQTGAGTDEELSHEPFLQERRIPDPHRRGAGVPRGQTHQPAVARTTARTATRRSSPRRSPNGEVKSVDFKNKGKALEVKLEEQRNVRSRLHRTGGRPN